MTPALAGGAAALVSTMDAAAAALLPSVCVFPLPVCP